MEIQVMSYPHCHLVKLFGRLDSETVPYVKQTLNNLTASNVFKIILDLTDISFISSAGWWIFIETQKNCKRNAKGELILSGLSEKIRHSLVLIGMSDYFTHYDNPDDAVKALKVQDA